MAFVNGDSLLHCGEKGKQAKNRREGWGNQAVLISLVRAQARVPFCWRAGNARLPLACYEKIDFLCSRLLPASMAQDATRNPPNLASRENLLDQVQNTAGLEKSQDASFLAQVTGNPFFTAVRAIPAESTMWRHR